MKPTSLVKYLVVREVGNSRGYEYLQEYGTGSVGEQVTEEKATIPSKNQACEFSGQTRSTFLMAFSPDGSLMASTHGDHAVRVSDLTSGKCLHTLSGHPRTPWCVAFHPVSNDILASGCLGGEVRIWDLRGGGSEVWRSDKNVSIASIAFHPTDQVLVFAVSNEVHFWDWTQPEPFATISTSYDYEKVRWVRFDPYGYHLYTGIGNGVSIQTTGEDNDLSQPGHTSGRHTSEERAQLQSQYRRILNEIHQLRRDRLRNGTQGNNRRTWAAGASDLSTSDPTPESMHTEAAGAEPSASSPRPSSPAHVDALTNARLYASAVTRTQNTSGQQAASSLQNSQEVANSSQGSQEVANSYQNSQEVASSFRNSQEVASSFQNSQEDTSSFRNSQEDTSSSPNSQEVGSSYRNSREVASSYRNSQRRSLIEHLRDIRQDGAERRAANRASASQDRETPGDISAQPSVSVITPTSTSSSRVQVTASMLSSFLRSQLTSSTQSSGASTAMTTISISTAPSTPSTSNAIQPVRVLSVTPSPARNTTGPQATTIRENLASAFRAQSRVSAASLPSSTSTSTSVSASTGGSIRGRFINYLNSTASSLYPEEHYQCSTGQCQVCQRYPSLAATQGSWNMGQRNMLILPRRVTRSTSRRDDTVNPPQSSRKLASVLETEVKKALDQVQARRLDISETLRDLKNLRQELGSHSCATPGDSQEGAGVGNTDETARISGAVGNAYGATSSAEGMSGADGTARTAGGADNVDRIVRMAEVMSDTDGTARMSEGVSNANEMAPMAGGESTNMRALEGITEITENSSQQHLVSSMSEIEATPGPSREHYSSETNDFPLTGSQGSSISNMSTDLDSSLSDLLLAPSTDRIPLEIRPESAMALPMRQNSNQSVSSTDDLELDNSSQVSNSSASSLGSIESLPSSQESLPSSQESLPSSQESNGGSPHAEATLNAIGQYSSEIERRVQELDHRISEIQNRLQDRLQMLQQRREKPLTRSSSHTVPRCVSVSERIRQRHDRLRAHLADLQSRYRRRIRMTRERRQNREELTQQEQPQQTPAADVPELHTEVVPTEAVHPEVVRTEAVHPEAVHPEVVHPEVVRNEAPQGNTAHTDTGPAAVSASSTSRGVRSITSSRRLWTEDISDTISNMRSEMARNRQLRREHYRNWHSLQRRHLHPHYSVSILDDTVNRPEEGLQSAINRAIAGAFVSSGESGVATNILNASYRIQRWEFGRGNIPDIKNSEENVIVPHCKLHNDAYCDLSQDGRFLAVFVPSHNGFPDDSVLAIYSLAQETFKQCLYTKSFGPNFVSVSISPLNNYVLVGLATRRLAWVFAPRQMVAQVYKVKTQLAGEDSMEHVCDLMHPCDMDIRTPVSVNSARWLPYVGEGIVYGTNRGDLHICRPGFEQEKKRNADSDGPQESQNVRSTWMMHMLGLNVPRTTSTATQTIQRVRRTASTQTDRVETEDNT